MFTKYNYNKYMYSVFCGIVKLKEHFLSQDNVYFIPYRSSRNTENFYRFSVDIDNI